MSDLYGRWDLTIADGSGHYASCVELRADGGWFVGKVGSARPVPMIEVVGDEVTWQLPKQYEGRSDDLRFHARLVDGGLVGSTTLESGAPTTFAGKRQAPLTRPWQPIFGQAHELIGASLAGWKGRDQGLENHWSIKDGLLDNATHGCDLLTEALFDDFRLVAEYRYPEGSNSGIYLRGRYEYQILDDYGTAPHVGGSGAIYGFIAPTQNSVRRFGEWNTAEITLLGRQITVVLNGVKVVDHQEISGITGDAIESEEGNPGPILLQGTHGPVQFRKLSLQPVTY